MRFFGMTSDRNTSASSIGLFDSGVSSRCLSDLALQFGVKVASNFLANFALLNINRSARSSGFSVIPRRTLRLSLLPIVWKHGMHIPFAQ